MRYFRVRREYDGKTMFGFAPHGGTRIVGIYREGQLLTKTEIQKMRLFDVPLTCDPVEVKKSNTEKTNEGRFLRKEN